MHCRALLTIVTLLSLANPAQAATPTELKIATWNLEWFMKPETMRALTPACTPADAPRDGARRSVPCDVANKLARSREDIAALRRYAEALDADIVALQEVDGADAARLVFHDYQFCFSGRVAVQNNGFAIRRGLPFSCGPELVDLSMNDDVRRGVELKVFPGMPQELRLLSVHLKSGCSRDPLDSTRAGCTVLTRQVPILERWIDVQANEHRPFAVLGDFNRDLRREPGGPHSGRTSMMAIRPRPTLSIRQKGKLFKTACLRRPSVDSSTTSFWDARWPRDWCRNRSDVRFSGRKTLSAASCQITARYLSEFEWQTPPAVCRKQKA